VFGTLISTFIVGYLVYSIGRLGWIDIDTSSPMEALLFGALISAVDPVATLSIMGSPELHCDPLLYSLVFGESVLNDAVSIVLFKVFMGFYNAKEQSKRLQREAADGAAGGGGAAEEVGSSSAAIIVPGVIKTFVIVSIGSVLVGIVIGLVCSYLCRHTKLYRYSEYEVGILFLFAYGSYAFSEALQLSGIMSLFICGIVLSHYNSYNLSPTSQVTAKYFFKSLAVLTEFFVFLYIGMGLFTGIYHQWSLLFSLLCILFCMAARACNIFPLSLIANVARQKKVPWNMQCVMWFAGLRGAISFALVRQ
jgi:sodium/hydrogen exchanger 8